MEMLRYWLLMLSNIFFLWEFRKVTFQFDLLEENNTLVLLTYFFYNLAIKIPFYQGYFSLSWKKVKYALEYLKNHCSNVFCLTELPIFSSHLSSLNLSIKIPLYKKELFFVFKITISFWDLEMSLYVNPIKSEGTLLTSDNITKTMAYLGNCTLSRELKTVKTVSDCQDSCTMPRQLQTVMTTLDNCGMSSNRELQTCLFWAV